MGRFDGRTVLVTGGTSGIGRAGVSRLVAEGARVIATGRRPERLDSLREEFPSVIAIEDDAASPGTGEALAAAVDEAGGGLDGLWLNAGYADVGEVGDVTADAFDRMMAANVRGPVLQLASLEPRLRPQASVVVTSSTSTYEGSPVATVYAATKGALVAAARGWAAALAPRGIRVNTLVPGPIETDFRHFMDPELKTAFEQDVLARVPLARTGRAEEAAAVGVFLLSDDASYVTGAQYAVDGGLTRV